MAAGSTSHRGAAAASGARVTQACTRDNPRWRSPAQNSGSSSMASSRTSRSGHDSAKNRESLRVIQSGDLARRFAETDGCAALALAAAPQDHLVAVFEEGARLAAR